MKKFVSHLIAGTVLAGLATSAYAADMPAKGPVQPLPMKVEAAGAWYLRGDIGYAVYDNPSMTIPVAGETFQNEDLKGSFFAGVGIGYQFNPWFRSDVTVDHHFKSDLKAINNSNNTAFYTWNGDFSATTILANAYLDFGRFGGFTPYVGAGVGMAHVSVDGLTSTEPTLTNIASGSDWNFAWALMAGTSYAFSPNMKLDLGYRYLNLGDVKTGLLTCSTCGGVPVPAASVKEISAHEFRVGFRYSFGAAASASWGGGYSAGGGSSYGTGYGSSVGGGYSSGGGATVLSSGAGAARSGASSAASSAASSSAPKAITK